MESFTSKLNEFVTILQTCFTDKVSEWKESDLQRVIDWADYFTKACDRMQERHYLTQRVDDHLKALSIKYGNLYEGKVLCWKHIASSHSYIVKALIENPSLPVELHDKLTTHSEKHDVVDCHSDITLPLHIHDFLSRAIHKSSSSFLSVHNAGYVVSLVTSLSDPSMISSTLSEIAATKDGMEAILYSLLPTNHRRKLLHLPETEEPPSQPLASEAILQWVLQVLIKPGHSVDQCERYLETQQFHSSLFSAVSSHHLRFFIGHITCMLEHYLTYFKFTGESSSASDLCDASNWVVIGTAGKVDVLVQNLKSLLEENEVMHDATIGMVSQYLRIK